MIRTPSSGKMVCHGAASRRVTFMVGALAEGRRALAIGRELGVLPVLLSPPGAAAWMGSPWWMALMAALRAGPEGTGLEETGAEETDAEGSDAAAAGPGQVGMREPGPDFIDILDCGAQAGRAVAALSRGLAWIVLDPECPQYTQVTVLAASLNAGVLSCRPEAIAVTPGLTARDVRERVAAGGDGMWESGEAL